MFELCFNLCGSVVSRSNREEQQPVRGFSWATCENKNVCSCLIKYRFTLRLFTSWSHYNWPALLTVSGAKPSPSLSFVLALFPCFTPAGSPEEMKPACAGLRSENNLVIYPLSFSFPRNATRFILMTWHQMTMDRTWGKGFYCVRELWWTRHALWVSARRGKKKCVWVCVCSCMQACACLLFSRLPQPYNMSAD